MSSLGDKLSPVTQEPGDRILGQTGIESVTSDLLGKLNKVSLATRWRLLTGLQCSLVVWCCLGAKVSEKV